MLRETLELTLDMRKLLFVLLLVAFPELGSAQARPDSVKLRNDCRLAEQVLTTGHPAPHREWASWTIRKCAGAGPVVAQAIFRLRTSADTALLKVVTAPAAVVRDREIYEAGLSILADATASSQARVYAIRMLAWLFYPDADLNYGDFVDIDGDGDRSCYGSGTHFHVSIVRGALLPPGWPDAIRQAARRVYENPAEPADVRQAARCFVLVRPSPILRRNGIEDAQR